MVQHDVHKVGAIQDEWRDAWSHHSKVGYHRNITNLAARLIILFIGADKTTILHCTPPNYN